MTNAPSQPSSRRPGGFTLAELIIGLLLVALIGGATAAVAAAVARGWQLGQTSHTSSLTIARTMLRVQDKIERAKHFGEWRAGSVSDPTSASGAALLFWRDDANRDGQMQLDETQLLEHDPLTQRLLVWEMAYPDPVTGAASNGPFPKTMLSGATAIDDYKLLPHAKMHAITNGVLGAQFNLLSATSTLQRPLFEFRLKFIGPNGPTVEYGTGSPRAPYR